MSPLLPPPSQCFVKIFAWQRKRSHLLAASALPVPVPLWRYITVECGGGYPFKGLTGSHSLGRELWGGRKNGVVPAGAEHCGSRASEAELAYNCSENLLFTVYNRKDRKLVSRQSIYYPQEVSHFECVKATVLSRLGWG